MESALAAFRGQKDGASIDVLVLGGTGKHFVSRALADGHKVRALVRTPDKLPVGVKNLEVRRGSITDTIDTDELVADGRFQDFGASAIFRSIMSR
jgi:uncharacterized protein YbjT (DUF2867 family)